MTSQNYHLNFPFNIYCNLFARITSATRCKKMSKCTKQLHNINEIISAYPIKQSSNGQSESEFCNSVLKTKKLTITAGSSHEKVRQEKLIKSKSNRLDLLQLSILCDNDFDSMYLLKCKSNLLSVTHLNLSGVNNIDYLTGNDLIKSLQKLQSVVLPEIKKCENKKMIARTYDSLSMKLSNMNVDDYENFMKCSSRNQLRSESIRRNLTNLYIMMTRVNFANFALVDSKLQNNAVRYINDIGHLRFSESLSLLPDLRSLTIIGDSHKTRLQPTFFLDWTLRNATVKVSIYYEFIYRILAPILHQIDKVDTLESTNVEIDITGQQDLLNDVSKTIMQNYQKDLTETSLKFQSLNPTKQYSLLLKIDTKQTEQKEFFSVEFSKIN